jgi:hypothetical protein
MAKVRTNKTVVNDAGEEVVVKVLEMNYEFNTLVVSEVSTNNQGEETVTPVMIQPWKCHSDGSRSAFDSEEDAYTWFESMKDQLA